MKKSVILMKKRAPGWAHDDDDDDDGPRGGISFGLRALKSSASSMESRWWRSPPRAPFRPFLLLLPSSSSSSCSSSFLNPRDSKLVLVSRSLISPPISVSLSRNRWRLRGFCRISLASSGRRRTLEEEDGPSSMKCSRLCLLWWWFYEEECTREICLGFVQKFKKCHASKHTCERHVDVCMHPVWLIWCVRGPWKWRTVSLIKKNFKRMKWSLFFFLKRGVLRVTRTKALENFTRCCAHCDEVSLFLSFFLSFSLTLGCPVLLVFFPRQI